METIIRVPGQFFSGEFAPYTNFGQYAYPPFNMLEVLPFAPLSLPTAYRLLTFINVAGVVLIGFRIPLHLARPRPISPLLAVALLTGLFS